MIFEVELIKIEQDQVVFRSIDLNLMNHLKKGNRYEIDLRLKKQKRTLDQNRLYWSLVRILAYHVYGEYGYEDIVHEELLNLYSPRIQGRIIRRSLPKRSKDLTKEEFARLIEGVFKELAENGAGVYQSDDIGKYWRDWRMWRDQQEHDPIIYSDSNDLVKRQIFCEACGSYLGERKTVAHIRSVGAGGSDNPENLLRLCDKCHLSIQHRKGWFEFVKKYPHLNRKITRALQNKNPLTLDSDQG